MDILILHGGIPKTGSSALQVFLARNRKHLEENSIDYFRIGDYHHAAAGEIASGNGSLVARSLLPDDFALKINDDGMEVTRLLVLIRRSKSRIGVLSSEFFASAEPNYLKKFLERIRCVVKTVKLVYFIRAQDQFMVSTYTQEVKRECCQQNPEAFVRERYKGIGYIHYATFYNQMVKLFGKENVSCLSFEDAVTSTRGLGKAFLDTIGFSDLTLPIEIEPVNRGLACPEITVMRILNRLKPRMRFSDMIIANSQQSAFSSVGTPETLISRELRIEVMNYFQDENSNFARDYFERDHLFVDCAYDNPHLEEPEALSVGDVLTILGGLVVQFDNRLAELESWSTHDNKHLSQDPVFRAPMRPRFKLSAFFGTRFKSIWQIDGKS